MLDPIFLADLEGMILETCFRKHIAASFNLGCCDISNVQSFLNSVELELAFGEQHQTSKHLIDLLTAVSFEQQSSHLRHVHAKSPRGCKLLVFYSPITFEQKDSAGTK